MERREIFGWVAYDWANSAYILTVATAVLPAYFAGVVVPPDGALVFGRPVAASVLWGLSVSLAAILVFLAAPVLGAVADHSGAKKRFLAVFCLVGAAAALGFGFCGPGDVALTLGLYVVGQVAFNCGNVFYDAFLPQIAPPEEYDRVSGLGYAWGYIGGALQFILALVLIVGHARFGLTQAAASRLGMGLAGLWWAGFAVVTLRNVRERPGSGTTRLSAAGYLRLGLRSAAASAREMLRGSPVGLFLAAFLLYNDGIQTVISMATIYGQEELKLSMTTLMGTLLAIQFIAFFGAQAFSRLAGRLGTRRALILALVLWTGVVAYAYTIGSATEYFVLGALVGVVLGGSQALSRSLYAAIVPEGQSAQYFGYFSVVTKLSAIGGPLVFAAVRLATGTSRDAILAVTVFFVAGIAILTRVRAGR